MALQKCYYRWFCHQLDWIPWRLHHSLHVLERRSIQYHQIPCQISSSLWHFVVEIDLIQDLQSLPRNVTSRKINDLIKRARLAKVHAYIIAELHKHMPSCRTWLERRRKRPNWFKISASYSKTYRYTVWITIFIYICIFWMEYHFVDYYY